MYDLIDCYKGNAALFMADRNYENYNIFAQVKEKGMYYMIHVKEHKQYRYLKRHHASKGLHF